MITGETLTAAEAVEKYGMKALLERRCVVITSMQGNGAADLSIGEIVDPDDCVIDEPDGALIYVEYQKHDDYYLASVFEDEPIVLLGELAA